GVELTRLPPAPQRCSRRRPRPGLGAAVVARDAAGLAGARRELDVEAVEPEDVAALLHPLDPCAEVAQQVELAVRAAVGPLDRRFCLPRRRPRQPLLGPRHPARGPDLPPPPPPCPAAPAPPLLPVAPSRP